MFDQRNEVLERAKSSPTLAKLLGLKLEEDIKKRLSTPLRSH
ncbi:MAG TPA: hypothetical protein VK203_00590 [Nostocaceae cyanobacterium]|nr:hypothetical protein [Nostocaceae cyanobacterium]